MVHHKGSNGTFAVLTLADLPQAASPPSRRAGGGLPGLAPVQAPHVHRRQPRHAPRDGPLPGPRHAPPPKPKGLAAVIHISQEGAEGTAKSARPLFHMEHNPYTTEGPLRSRGGGLPWQNAPWWPAASCSPTDCSAVPSALGGLTSGFGMGPGVPPLPWPPAAKGRSAIPGGPRGRALRAAQRDRQRRAPRRSRRKSSAD